MIFIIMGFRTIVFIFIVISKRFGRYVLRFSLGVCRTREPSRNSELRPLFNKGRRTMIKIISVSQNYFFWGHSK